MLESIKKFIERLKLNPRIHIFDEASTKQAIVLPLLGILGWCTYDVDEVVPEYQVESRRVDYALRLNNTSEFFIEVKNTGEELDKYEEQLLDYSFRQGVQLGALTNGITWWFYLPTKKGSWKTRKFYTIDFLKQEIDDVSNKFIDLLSKDNVKTGQALTTAETIYNSRLKEKTLKDTIPEAWNTIVSEPDMLLVDLIAETTERLCGFKPEIDEVKTFMRSINTPSPVPSVPPREKVNKGIPKGHQILPLGKIQDILKLIDLPVYFPYKGKVHEALMPKQEVIKAPKVIYEGKEYSLSAAAVVVIQKYNPGRRTSDGWKVWRYKEQKTGELIPIDELRK
jgi:hypothetical protein